MTRKQTFFLSITSGLLLCLPWLFSFMGWTLLIAFVPLLLAEEQVIQQKNERNLYHLFLLALPAFLIWNLCSTWWIGYVSWGGMLLIAILNSLLMTSVWWLRHLVRMRVGAISSLFSLPAFWLTFEYLHHHWDMPWPWLSLGNGLANWVKIIQWYEFSGVLGGSLWILVSNIFILLLIRSVSDKTAIQSAKLAICIIFILLLPIYWSISRYSNYKESGSALNVVVLQPNINPYTEKFSGISPEEQVEKLISLTRSVDIDSTAIFVAPETALPEMWEDSLSDQHPTMLSISQIFSKNPGVSMVAGAMTKRRFRNDEPLSSTARKSDDGNYYFDVYNSALLINQTSTIQYCHKSILVSGVEMMPFQKYLSFLSKHLLQIGGVSGSLGAAEQPTVFTVNESVKVGPVICFESAFGEHCGKLVKLGASVLIVITNDGWWKDSPGSWQHFSYSRIRAIETRRSVARSANTGISGFINQRGDILKKTSLNTSSALQASIHLNTTLTFYSKHGDWIGKISSIWSGMILLFMAWGWYKNDWQ